MLTSRTPRVHLLAIATAALALLAAGCCRNVPDDVYSSDFDGTVMGDDFTNILMNTALPEARCASACQRLADQQGEGEGEVLECEAFAPADMEGEPWDPEHTAVDITCTLEFTEPGFCTGRRPQGHHEAELELGSRAAWFTAHAHLERASITAFRELAGWLRGRAAPSALIDRCEAAALDEVRHAGHLEALALREGGELHPVHADPPADDLETVALHNAVEGCVSEAFAAVIAGHQAAHADDPALRSIFAELHVDELRHGQLAWDLHAWLWDQLTPAQRSRVAAAQSRALAELPAHARRGAAATPRELGWPAPARAVALADAFARRITAALALDLAA